VYIVLDFTGDSCKESIYHCWKPRSCGFDCWVRKIPWRRKWQPTSVFLLGNFLGQWNLAGYSPLVLKKSDTIEVTEHILKISL